MTKKKCFYGNSLFSSPHPLDFNILVICVRKLAAFSFAVLGIIVFRLSSILGAVSLFKPNMLLICNMVWHVSFLWDSFCLSAVSRQRHDILNFSCCPLSLVLHVTRPNLQKF